MEDHDTTPVPADNAAGPETSGPPSSLASDELAEQKKKYEDLNDRYLRLAADFDNYRKRVTRDHEAQIRLANERFAVDILEIADNLDRALMADEDHLRTGVDQIRQLLAGVLARHGVTPIDALKTSFNPGVHEAIAHIPSDEKEGVVVDVVSPGYRMHDKVIRYAKVAVSKGNQP
ncbi:nucleotide exchange factor GrpE [Methanoregula sp.]|uniref:nucleotide exchange factor GrpE n=1 Tax=Methanoregula sp. TaxID=2052170 RepID=UPI002C766956|nr:nucleotide exchange factor GrpE [Methanoregula sp.]HVP95997.1 nucleotide exchange factor GrpE [Methanoregula sp.]